jgi:trehalose/maltose transport system substrate-binding protein
VRETVRIMTLWLIAGVCVAGALSGCQRPVRSPPGQSVLRLLLPASELSFWKPLAQRFEDRHRGARVELVEGPQSTDLREDLYTASLLARDPTFDIVTMDVTWTAKFAAAGWLRPLDSALSAQERRAFLPAALDAGIYAGRLYRLPVRTDVGTLYYRRDLLEAAGLTAPATLDELERACRAVQRPPALWGFVWQGKQYEGLVCTYLEVLAGCGGTWVDPRTLEVGLDRPEALQALQFLTRCLGAAPISPPGVTTYEEEESRHLFQDGRAVFLRSWPYVWSLAQEEGSRVRGRVGVTSMAHAAGQTSAATLGGWGLAVSRFSRNPSLAIEFLRLATSLEGQRLLCLPTGFAPARLEAYRDSALIASNPLLPRLAAIHIHAVARPAIPRYALVSDALQRHLSAALSGTESPEVALASAAQETRHALGARAASRTRAGGVP